MIEFERENDGDETGMRGRLTARGRDLPKAVQHIEFDPATFRWLPITGAPQRSAPVNAREKALAVLDATDDWLTAEEIADRIPDASIKSVQNALTAMVSERYRPLLVQGSGTKGDARRYHGIRKRAEITPSDSGIDPGTNGHRPEATLRDGVLNAVWANPP